ncbi:hypothetical protein [Sulfitobacter sp.]|uniref:hypothetical protein n=1 Tax=Sulfitobacter sp. TaxID=1903071 RepID=UPI003296EBF9
MSEIFLHVGYGKTGTTAVQGWLLRNRDALADRGILDCGTAMHNPVFKPSVAQSVPALVQCIGADRSGTAAQLAAQVNDAAEDYQTIVWSSEFMLARMEFVSEFVQGIDDKHDVKIVIYLRNHIDWLLSAYAQWAIKHPITMEGPGVASFDNFVAQRINDLDYVSKLSAWSSIEGAELLPRSYDAQSNIVADFVELLGLDIADFPVARGKTNENLGRAQLSLLKIIQENTENKIDYRRFTKMLADAGAAASNVHPVDPTAISVDAQRLAELHDGFARQRRKLNTDFGVKLSDTFKANRNGSVEGSNDTNTDLISMLGMVCYTLAQRTAALERKIKDISARQQP